MKRYKLKKEVKEILIFGVIATIAILLVAAVNKSSKEEYEECLINNNNDVNFCHELIAV